MDLLLYSKVIKVLNLKVFVNSSKIGTQHPHHPHSQGEIEVIVLYVRGLSSKMEYDSLKMEKKGLYLAKALAGYQRVSKEEPKRSTKIEISILSAFRTRKPSYHTNQAFIHLERYRCCI